MAKKTRFKIASLATSLTFFLSTQYITGANAGTFFKDPPRMLSRVCVVVSPPDFLGQHAGYGNTTSTTAIYQPDNEGCEERGRPHQDYTVVAEIYCNDNNGRRMLYKTVRIDREVPATLIQSWPKGYTPTGPGECKVNGVVVPGRKR